MNAVNPTKIKQSTEFYQNKTGNHHLYLLSQNRNSVWLIPGLSWFLVLFVLKMRCYFPQRGQSVPSSITDTPNSCRVIGVFLEMTGL